MASPLKLKVTAFEHKSFRDIGWTMIAYASYSYYRVGYTQKAPFDYTTLNASIMTCLSGQYESSNYGNAIWDHPLRVETINQARAKFVGKLGEASQIGSTLTSERRATWRTVSGGITSLLMAARAVKKGRLGEASKILGFYPPEIRERVSVRRIKRDGSVRRIRQFTRTSWRMPDGKVIAKSLGNKWLWYSYGIKPLVGDIYNGMDILQRPVPGTKVSANVTTIRRDFPVPNILERSYKVHISAMVQVINPNLWLANQLGLINPVQMFNEGIPFSFVIDWFSNLSQVISQMTDFVGLDIAKPVTFHRSYERSTINSSYPPYTLDRTNIQRELIIPTAELRFAYERFQWQRGANAASLLVQVLKTK